MVCWLVFSPYSCSKYEKFRKNIFPTFSALFRIVCWPFLPPTFLLKVGKFLPTYTVELFDVFEPLADKLVLVNQLAYFNEIRKC